MSGLRGRGRVLIALTALAAAVAATSAPSASAARPGQEGGPDRRPFVIDLLSRDAGADDDAVTLGTAF